MTPVNVLPDVETKKFALAGLVSTQAGTGPKFVVRRGAGQSKGKGDAT